MTMEFISCNINIYRVDICIYYILIKGELNVIDYIILGFLMDKEMSGYDIKQRITLSTSNFYDASFGSIYPALKRLEAKNWINSNEIIEAGRFKKKYRILEEGNRIFLTWLEEPLIIHPSRHEWLVKIFFYRYLPKDTVLLLIRQFNNFIVERKKKIAEIEPLVRGKADFFQMSTLHYGIDYYEFIINWLQRYLEAIEQPGFREKNKE